MAKRERERERETREPLENVLIALPTHMLVARASSVNDARGDAFSAPCISLIGEKTSPSLQPVLLVS